MIRKIRCLAPLTFDSMSDQNEPNNGTLTRPYKRIARHRQGPSNSVLWPSLQRRPALRTAPPHTRGWAPIPTSGCQVPDPVSARSPYPPLAFREDVNNPHRLRVGTGKMKRDPAAR